MNKSLLFSRLYAIGLFMLFSSGWALGQTTLNPGDIMIVTVNADGSDNFDFVPLVNLKAGTVIYFTDNAWTGGAINTNEGTVKYTSSSAVVAGTVISFSGSIGGEWIVEDAGFNAAAAGDNILVFQGSSLSPEFIYGVGWAISSPWPYNSNTNTSDIPDALSTDTKTIVSLGTSDNYQYNISNGISGGASELLALLANSANYDGNSTAAYTALSTTFILTDPIWNGSTDTDWTDSNNWTNGLPDANLNVTIPTGLDNYPVVSTETSANCNNLTLEENATLTIQSDATNSGSLIIGGTYTGSATAVTYQRYFADINWHMLGSPFTGQTIDATFLSSNNISDMKDYIESENPLAWSTNYTNTAPDVDFSLGKGYATKLSSAGLVSLSGTINNATVNVTLTHTGFGWNLLSNPFTSAIAANNDGGADNLIANNTAALDDSYEAVYIWDGSTYVIINHASPATPSATLVQNYLQTGQGFFVKSADPAAGTFTITPAMQSHQTAIAFKSTEESSWASISLNAEISNAKSSTSILYRNDMNRSLDIGYDAGILKSGSLVLYSRLINDNGIDFGVQCLPEDYDNLIVPIGLDAIAGEIVTFTAKSLNIPEDYAVVLEDRAMNTFIDLSDEGEYVVQLDNASEGTGRFFVRTSMKSALGIGDIEKEAFQVFTRVNDHQLVIRGEVKQNTSARIYSITGQLMTEAVLEQSVENRIPFDGTTGIYLVRITSKEGATTHKFTWAN